MSHESTSTTTHERTIAAAAQALDPMSRIQAAMAPYKEALKEDWGKEFDALVRYLANATAPWRTHVAALADAVKKAPATPRLIIVGERGWPESGRPEDHDQFLAAIEAARRLEDTPFHILFTGGCDALYGHFGEMPAWDMAHAFNRMTKRVFQTRITVDQMSDNTGHQARIIGAMIRARRYGEIVVCLPIEHIARFTATLCYDLQEYNEESDALQKATGTARRVQETHVLCFAHGEWDEVIPKRGPAHHGLTRAQEAFGDLASPALSPLPSKTLGGEYRHIRYGIEAFEGRQRGYACPALKPSDMYGYLIRTS